MEEGLKVILSADVSQYVNSLSKAAQETGKSVQQINQTLKGAGAGIDQMGATVARMVPHWQKFSSIFMNPFMREFGGHTEEMGQALGAALEKVKKGTITFDQLLKTTKFTGEEMAALPQKIAAIPIDWLERGLDKAQKTLVKFGEGKRSFTAVQDAIDQLRNALPGLGNPEPIERLIQSLEQLKATKKGLGDLAINPTVHVADTLKDIEKIKGLVASEKFNFTLTADAKGLTASMQGAVTATEGASEAIQHSCHEVEQAVEGMSDKAKLSVAQYVQAIGRLDNVPMALKATVQAPDFKPVIAGIQQVKAEIATTTFTALPKFTLQADTTQFKSDLTTAAGAAGEAAQAIAGSFQKISQNVKTTADLSGTQIAELNRNLQIMRGTQGGTIALQLKAPDFRPVIEAAKKAKQDINAVFLEPLPPVVGLQKLNGDGNNLSRTINQLEQDLREFEAILGRSNNTSVLKATGQAMNETRARLTELRKIAGQDTFGHFNKSTDRASSALLDLSRVVQDAPYGFIGIANNLNPLVESFGRLTKQSGGFRGAMVALAGSLKGAGGVGLAVAAASTLLIAFGDKLFKSGDSAKKAAIQLRSFAIETRLANAALENAAAGNAAGSITHIQTLRLALNDLTLPLSQRNKALDEYNKLADKGNQIAKTDIENIGKVNAAINEQIELFKKRALVKAAEGEIEKLFKELFKFEFAADTAGNKFGALFDKPQKSVQTIGSTFKQMGDAANQAGVSMQEFANSFKGTGEVVDNVTGNSFNKTFGIMKAFGGESPKVFRQIDGINSRIRELFAFIDKQIKAGANFGDMFEGVKGKDAKKPKFEFLEEFLDFDPNSAKLTGEQKAKLIEVINRYSDQFGQILDGANFRSLGTNEDQQIQAAKEWWDRFQKGFIKLAPRKIDVDFSQIPVQPKEDKMDDIQMPITLTFTPEQIRDMEVQDKINSVVNNWREIFKEANIKFPKVDTSNIIDLKKLNDTYRAIKGFVENVNDILKGALADGFSALGDVIGDALTGKDIKSGVQAIVAVLGDAITAMGKALIEYGIVKAGLDKILAGGIAIPGGAAIVAGVAAIAAGALVRNSFKTFADGGLIFGPTLGLMGEYAGAKSNPEVVAPLSKLKDMIKGAGGGGNMHLSGNFRVAGTDLVLALERTTRSQRRTY